MATADRPSPVPAPIDPTALELPATRPIDITAILASYAARD